VNLSETPNPSWPEWRSDGLAGEKNFVTVAFLPMLSDIAHLMKANGYLYWLRNINDGCCAIKSNGDSIMGSIQPNSQYFYVRPCIWVTSKL
jgi:hypothetical protein